MLPAQLCVSGEFSKLVCICTQTFSREFCFVFWASLMENCLFWNGEGLERAHGDNNDDDDDLRVLVADIYDLSLSLHTSRRQRCCCCSCCNQREKKKKNSRWLKTDSPDSDGHTTFFFPPRQIRIHSAHLSLLDSFFILFGGKFDSKKIRLLFLSAFGEAVKRENKRETGKKKERKKTS